MPNERAGAGCGVCRLQRNGYGPAGEAVDDGEEVRVALAGWQRAHQVHIDVFETTSRDLEGGKRSTGVTLDLGALAGKALLGPLAHLLGQAMPDELGRD